MLPNESIVILRSDGKIFGDTTIWVRPRSIAFRGYRIAIPDDIAPFFDIIDLKVGNRSVLSSSPVGGHLFACRMDMQAKLILSDTRPVQVMVSEPATAEFGRAITMETCQTAMDMSVTVRLKGGEPHHFEMYILGRSVDV
jgi:hypothetical protein